MMQLKMYEWLDDKRQKKVEKKRCFSHQILCVENHFVSVIYIHCLYKIELFNFLKFALIVEMPQYTRVHVQTRVSEYCYHVERGGRGWILLHYFTRRRTSVTENFIFIYNIFHPWDSYFPWVFLYRPPLFFHSLQDHQDVLSVPEKYF